MAVTVASLEARFGADTTEFDRKAGQVSNRMAGLGRDMQGFGRDMGRIGQKLTLAMAPAALALGFSIKQAIAFESAFAGVEKTVDGTEAELSALRSTIREMATSSDNPLAGLENAHLTLAQIMELGGQLGVPKEKLESFTQVVGELGIATDLTTEEAAMMSAQFANITGMSFDNLDRFGATLVDLGNNSAATESMIAGFAMRLAGVGNTVGLREDQILGLSAAMASVGLNAEAGGTAMTTVFNEMISAVAGGGAELDNFARVAGVSAEEFASTWEASPVSALNMFLGGLGELDEAAQVQALEDLNLDGIRVADTLRRLSGNTDLVVEAFDLAAAAWAENTALSEEANKRFATTEAQMNLLKNRISDVGITIGDILLPALNDILTDLGPLVEKVNQYAQAHPEVITQVTALTLGLMGLGLAMTILGPIVTGLGTLLAFGGTALAVGMGITTTAVSVLGTALAFGGGALAVAFGILTSPITLTVAAIAAITVAIIALTGKIGPISEKLREVFAPALEWVKGIIDSVEAKLRGLIGSLQGFAYDVTYALRGVPGVPDYHQFAPTGSAHNPLEVDSAALFDTESIQARYDELYGNGGQHGIAWTGHGPLTQEAGVFHRGESVIPAGGMTAMVVPSPQGPLVYGAGGGGGVQINISQLDVHGVENPEQLFDKLQRVARQRA